MGIQREDSLFAVIFFRSRIRTSVLDVDLLSFSRLMTTEFSRTHDGNDGMDRTDERNGFDGPLP